MLRQYRHELAEFVQLRYELTLAPIATVQNFCRARREAEVLLALQCRQSIATRQRADVCEVAASLPQNTRRYYYLQLDCQLHSKWLHMPLPKLNHVIFG